MADGINSNGGDGVSKDGSNDISNGSHGNGMALWPMALTTMVAMTLEM